MKHEEEYEIVLSDEKIPVIILKNKDDDPQSPFILYDGKNHGTFYRRPDEVILLDYIPAEIQPLLRQAPFVVIMEMNSAQDDIARDYKALLKIVKNNPLTDGLK